MTGSVSGYSVSPALPAGLTLDTSGGSISGTPTAVTAAATYLVTASNSGGSTTANVSITVNDIPPLIAYPSGEYSFTAGVTAQAITATASGGAIVSCFSTPPLPAGLTVSPDDCTISGTATGASAAGNYTVTATNSGGAYNASLSVAVSAGPILDFGLGSPTLLRLDATNVFGQDNLGRWVLWNFATAAMVASGRVNCQPQACAALSDYAGPTIAVQTASGLDLHSSVDGHLVASVATTPAWWKLATDGSYVCAGSTSGLMVWSASGQPLASRPGDYSNAVAYALPGAVVVALGPAGQNVIETITTSSGESSIGPAFQGAFSSWFVDGGSFLTVDSTTNTIRVYSNSTALQDTRPLPGFGSVAGTGNWFWTTPALATAVNIYAVGASATPAASYPLTVSSILWPSGTSLGIANFDASAVVSVIDLGGATPAKVDYTPPFQDARFYAATSASHWIIANTYGVVLDGSSLPASSRFFGYGQPLSIVGGTGHYAVATASGTTFYFNSATNAPEGQIAFPSSNLAMSSDGTLLAAQADAGIGGPTSTDASVRIYSLPSGALIYTFPFTTNGSPTLGNMTLSASGAVLGEELGNPLSQQTVPIAGGAPTVIPTTSAQFMCLSPDGTRTAVANNPAQTGGGQSTATSFYLNGTLTTALSGWAVGWLDNGRLLVNNYETKFGDYVGASIYSPTGSLLASPPIPEVEFFQVVTPQVSQPQLIYAPRLNVILSLNQAVQNQIQWASGSPSDSYLLYLKSGAVAGSNIVFVSGDQLLSEPFSF